jgi:hypothetical protein
MPTPEEMELLQSHRFDRTEDKLVPTGMPVVPPQQEASLNGVRLTTLSGGPDMNPHLHDARPVIDVAAGLKRPDNPHAYETEKEALQAEQAAALERWRNAEPAPVEPDQSDRPPKPHGKKGWKPDPDTPKAQRIKARILQILADGPHRSTEVREILSKEGHGPIPVTRCLKALNVRMKRDGEHHVWYDLPPNKQHAGMTRAQIEEQKMAGRRALKAQMEKVGPMPEVLPESNPSEDEQPQAPVLPKVHQGREVLVCLPDYMTTEREECERQISNAYRRVKEYALAMAEFNDGQANTTRCAFCNNPVDEERAEARLPRKNPRTNLWENLFFDKQTCYILWFDRNQRSGGDAPGSFLTSRESGREQ